MKKKPTGHGGWRPGSGRKPKNGGGRKTSLYLPNDLLDELDKHVAETGGAKSEFVAEAIRKHLNAKRRRST